MTPEKPIKAMALFRLLCSVLELAGVFLILRSTTVRTALRINALLALIGPVLLVLSWIVGIAGMALESAVTLRELLLVVAGVILVVVGTSL